MESQEILALYVWHAGICFRHPEKGPVDTTVVKTIHPRGEGDREVRACADCVIAIEDTRREAAAREGSVYEPGQAGGEAG
jgi:hypothetical protein